MESKGVLTADHVKKGLDCLGINPLSSRHALLELSLTKLELKDIAILENFPHVMYLNISENSIESLSILGNMPTLVQLNAR